MKPKPNHLFKIRFAISEKDVGFEALHATLLAFGSDDERTLYVKRLLHTISQGQSTILAARNVQEGMASPVMQAKALPAITATPFPVSLVESQQAPVASPVPKPSGTRRASLDALSRFDVPD